MRAVSIFSFILVVVGLVDCNFTQLKHQNVSASDFINVLRQEQPIVSIYKRFTAAYTHFVSKKGRDCLKDLYIFGKGLRNNEEWAVQMMDASAKIANGHGLFELNLLWLGSSSICQRSKSPYFETHFCWPRFLKQDIKIEFCLPTSCEESYFNDIILFFQDLLECSEMNFQFPVDKMICLETLDSLKVTDTFSQLTKILLLAWMGFIILITLIEIFTQRKKEKTSDRANQNETDKYELPALTEPTLFDNKLKVCTYQLIIRMNYVCSITKNLRKVFNTKVQEDSLGSLFGIRSLALSFLIWGHIIIKLTLLSDNLLRFFQMFENNPISSILLLNGYINSVSTFFIISGFVLTYSYLKSAENEKPTWIQFYLKRIFRISPAYYFVILLYTQIYIKEASQNYSHYLEDMRNSCGQMWWKNILYINNFFRDQCLENSWYFACIMQLYLVSPLLLIFIKRSKYLAVITLSTVLISSIVITFIIAYTNDLLIGMYKDALVGANQVPTFFYEIFVKPYTRAGSFIIGMTVGWLVFETKGKVAIKKEHVLFLWLITVACFYLSFFFIHDFELGKLGSAIWFAIHDVIWSLGLSTLIFLCCTGYGGIINAFLSWPGWIVCYKLSFSSALIYILVIEVALGVNNNHFLQIYSVLFFPIVFQLVCFVAMILHLLIEAPVLNLWNSTFGVKIGVKMFHQERDAASMDNVKKRRED